MPEITVNTNSKSYPVYIENEPIENLRDKILPNNGKYLVVISKKVEKIYGKILNIPTSNKFILKDGEEQKNFKNYRKILEKAFELKLTRKDSFIAIGGGVVGDLTGFAASTYMRGIGFIQVPTTLLACVDSSVGGKTAVNTKFGKNLIGCFYQPNAVYINPKFLNTLDERQFKSGLGEVIKYVFIQKKCSTDFDLAQFLSENSEKVLSRDEKILENIIEYCINFKKYIVECDEKESDLRRVLNFGHTYGHAIERITDYRKYTHGEAVIEGIRFAFCLALKKSLIDADYVKFANDLIDKFGYKKLPIFDFIKIVELMKSDKKSNQNELIFVLPTGYGNVEMFGLNVQEI